MRKVRITYTAQMTYVDVTDSMTGYVRFQLPDKSRGTFEFTATYVYREQFCRVTITKNGKVTFASMLANLNDALTRLEKAAELAHLMIAGIICRSLVQLVETRQYDDLLRLPLSTNAVMQGEYYPKPHYLEQLFAYITACL